MKIFNTLIILSLLTVSQLTYGQPYYGGGNRGLIKNVVDEVTDLLSDASYKGGSFSNIAVNSSDILATVDLAGQKIKLGGTPATVSVAVTQNLTSSNINASSSEINQNNNTTKSNLTTAVTNTTENIATANSNAVANISAIALANSISATAIGAMNTGNVDLTQAQRSGLGGLSTYNPSVANLAVNTSDITSAVTISAVESLRINNTSISAAAVGAMNTGNISVTAPPTASSSRR
ncbi:hypothetical protein ICN19_04895 [Polynucleobacter sp. AP-Capit-er-40B-B4]|uniref:hypothetical protein n=1 Tax=Polynucleobacter sp. AP-Capit-er-40B-B4 TaxID=2576927 RepID=UPI001C0D1BC7|nr:hypothetical protein [Polynucleobacter sp. AP-Capit-er-40B-B4]MBU3581348.1 hypothetical protein [Polynucleobacter sp. AP-Capit-er-40B-B4]